MLLRLVQRELAIRVWHDDRRTDVGARRKRLAQVGRVRLDEERDLLRHLTAEQQPDAADEHTLPGVVSRRPLDALRLELARYTEPEVHLAVDCKDVRRDQRSQNAGGSNSNVRKMFHKSVCRKRSSAAAPGRTGGRRRRSG